MNEDMLLPLVATLGWLILASSAVASMRLGWGQMAKMALAWVVIFGAVFVIVQWFFYVQNSASSLI